MRSKTENLSSSENIAILITLVCLAAILATGLGVAPLQEPDEGRYGLIAYAMAHGGDWITPHLDAISYFEKPALFFWITGAAIKLFGTAEWVIRLPSLLAAILTAGIVMWLARRSYGMRAALPAGIIFATAPLVALFARVCVVDVVLTFLIAAQLALLWLALVEPDDSDPPRLGLIVLFHATAGLAMLDKGPVGIALPAVAFTTYALVSKRPKLLLRVLHPVGLLTFAAVAAPWYLAMNARHPTYLKNFFLQENLARFSTGGVFKREAPFWSYLVALPILFLPWSGALVEVGRQLVGDRERPDSREKRARWFFACAVVAPLVLLSIAHSKLAYYILPLFPAVALVTADALTRPASERSAKLERSVGRGFGFWAVSLLLLAVAIGVAAMLPEATLVRLFWKDANPASIQPPVAVMRHAALWFAPALAAAGIGSLLASIWIRRGLPLQAIGAAAAGMIILMTSVPFIASAPMESVSGKRLAAIVSKIARPADTLLFYGRFQRTTVYYLERPVMLWDASYEEFGHEVSADEARGRALQNDRKAFDRLVEGPGRVLILTARAKDTAEIRSISPVPLHELGGAGSYSVLSNRAPAKEQIKDQVE